MNDPLPVLRPCSPRLKMFLLVAACCLVATVAGELQACPTCKDSIAASSNNMNLVRGYGWSIIFMMSAPFLILFSLGTYFYLLVRRAANHPELYRQQRPEAAVGELQHLEL